MPADRDPTYTPDPADAKREWSVRFADGYVSTVRHTERSARLRAADYGHDNAEPVHRAVGPWLSEESGS
jgi:hypothetical protein